MITTCLGLIYVILILNSTAFYNVYSPWFTSLLVLISLSGSFVFQATSALLPHPHLKAYYFYLACLLFSLFLALSLAVALKSPVLQALNHWVFHYIQEDIQYFKINVDGLQLLSHFGNRGVRFFWVLLIASILLKQKHPLTRSFLIIISVFTGCLLACKLGLNVARPLQKAQSFPSGHVALIGLLSLITLDLFFKSRVNLLKILMMSGAILFTLMTATSRLYLHKHWLTDIIGALLLASCAYCAWKTMTYHKKQENKKLAYP